MRDKQGDSWQENAKLLAQAIIPLSESVSGFDLFPTTIPHEFKDADSDFAEHILNFIEDVKQALNVTLAVMVLIRDTENRAKHVHDLITARPECSSRGNALFKVEEGPIFISSNILDDGSVVKWWPRNVALWAREGLRKSVMGTL